MKKEVKGKTVYYNGDFHIYTGYTESHNCSEIDMKIRYKNKDYRVIYDIQKDVKYRFHEKMNESVKNTIIKEIEVFLEIKKSRDAFWCE